MKKPPAITTIAVAIAMTSSGPPSRLQSLYRLASMGSPRFWPEENTREAQEFHPAAMPAFRARAGVAGAAMLECRRFSGWSRAMAAALKQPVTDASHLYEVERRARHCERKGFRITELQLSPTQTVPWHTH